MEARDRSLEARARREEKERDLDEIANKELAQNIIDLWKTMDHKDEDDNYKLEQLTDKLHPTLDRELVGNVVSREGEFSFYRVEERVQTLASLNWGTKLGC